MRRSVVAMAGAAVVLGLAAEAVAYDWDAPERWLPDLVVGWTMLGAGIVVWGARRARGAAVLLMVTGVTWFVGLTPATLYLHRGPLVHLLVAFAGWRPRTRLAAAAIRVGYVAAVVAPLSASGAATVALVVGLVAVTARGYLVAEPRARHDRFVAAAAALIYAGVLVSGVVATSLVHRGDAVLPALVAYQAALVVVVVVLVSGVVAPSPSEVADLVVELSEGPDATVRDRLARVLGDPTLEVGYWSLVEQVYLSAQGEVVELPHAGSGRAVTRVGEPHAPVAVLVHDPETLRDSTVIDAVGRAARLSGSHLALQEELRRRRDEIAGSRQRLLLAADDERRRLAQRLRLGVEAQLDTLAQVLARLDDSAAPASDGADHLVSARHHLTEAREDLDALAAGLLPRELAAGSLPDAIEALVERSPVPLTVDIDAGHLPADVETAAYFLCAEALANLSKHARARSARVRAWSTGDRLWVEVVDDGVGGASLHGGSGLRGLADRVETLGGSFECHSPVGSGTRLLATFPSAPWFAARDPR